MGEETPSPQLSRRVPGATREGPAPSVYRRLPDSLMARMQAAVEAARAAEAGGSDGDAGSSEDSNGSGGSSGSFRANGVVGASGVSAEGTAGGAAGVEDSAGSRGGDTAGSWGGPEQEFATEPLPNLQAALAEMDLARQYGSLPTESGIGPADGPAPDGPADQPSGLSEVTGQSWTAGTDQSALAGPWSQNPGGQAEVQPGMDFRDDRAAWWEHAARSGRPRLERAGRAGRSGKGGRAGNPARSDAGGTLDAGAGSGSASSASGTGQELDAPWGPARARRERSRWSNRTTRRERAADSREPAAGGEGADSANAAHPWTNLDPSWLADAALAPASGSDPAPAEATSGGAKAPSADRPSAPWSEISGESGQVISGWSEGAPPVLESPVVESPVLEPPVVESPVVESAVVEPSDLESSSAVRLEHADASSADATPVASPDASAVAERDASSSPPSVTMPPDQTAQDPATDLALAEPQVADPSQADSSAAQSPTRPPTVEVPAEEEQTAQTPAVEARTVQVPAVPAPTVQTPAIGAPTVQVPAVPRQTVQVPADPAPVAQIPVVQIPAVPAGQSADRRGPGESRRQRRSVMAGIAALAVLLIAGGTVALLLSSRNSVVSSSDNKGARNARVVQRARIADNTATWVAGQVSHHAVVSCDRLMCDALAQHGFPASRLLRVAARATHLPKSQIVVATPALEHQFGKRLDAKLAPVALAGFGKASELTSVRVIAPHGATAYLNALRVDRKLRQTVGTGLITSRQITATAVARKMMESGEVDSRLLIVITALAAERPIDILSIGPAGAGASPGVPARVAELAGITAGVNLTESEYVQAMVTLLRAQPPRYRPSSISTVHTSAGQKVLRIEFPAPSPLGLLNPTQ